MSSTPPAEVSVFVIIFSYSVITTTTTYMILRVFFLSLQPPVEDEANLADDPPDQVVVR